MIGTELYFSLFTGVLLSLLFAERFGISPAGLVVPGYLALIFDQPVMLFSILLISCITYIIVDKVLSKIIILYGRRKFSAMILTAMILKFIFDAMFPYAPIPHDMIEISGIGMVIPGIIANTIQRQGVVITLSSSLFVTFLTYILLNVYNYVVLL